MRCRLIVFGVGVSALLALTLPAYAVPAFTDGPGVAAGISIGDGAPVRGPQSATAVEHPSAGGCAVPDFFGLGKAAIPIEPSAPREPVATLPGVPSALLLALFGCLCVGLVQGRRRWTAFLVGLCSVCAAGLGSLPRLMAARKARQSVHRPTAGAFHPPADYLSLSGRSAETEFAGLLHRLGGEADAGAGALDLAASFPAVGASLRRAAAGSFVPRVNESDSGVLSPDGAAVQRDAEGVCLPRRRISAPSCPLIPQALFARPPPAVST